MAVFRRIANLFRRSRIDREIEAELQSHIALLIDDNLARGMSAAEARRDALVRFGNPTATRERVTAADTMLSLDALAHDLRFALRQLRRSPGFTIAAVSALALGIGANTAIFSVVNAVLLKPLTYPNADRIVEFVLPSSIANNLANIPEFHAYQRQTSVFQEVAAYDRISPGFNLTGERPELIQGIHVTESYFRLFGAPVVLGRTFTPQEDAPYGGKVVVLSYHLWQRRFGGNPDVIGKSLSLGNEPYTIVGIIGPQFVSDPEAEFWLPYQFPPVSDDMNHYFLVAGLLKPGVTLEQANAQLKLASVQYRRDFPRSNPHQIFRVAFLRDAIVSDTRSSLLVLLGTCGLVLLIACANVANLLLVRATGRQREFAIRSALGAGRGRIVRQLLTESILLSIAGGISGLVIGFAGVRALLVISPAGLPRVGENGSALTMDWRVLGFTLAISLLTGVLFGLIPALSASRSDVNSMLKESSGRSGTGFRQGKARSFLVVSEVSLALVLLIGSGLLIRTLIALHSVSPGFDSHHVLALDMSLTGDRFHKTEAVAELSKKGRDRLNAIPGVEISSAAYWLPIQVDDGMPFEIFGRPAGKNVLASRWISISPGYLGVFKIPVLRGRDFNENDTASAPGVALINQAMVKRFWPNEDPMGQQILLGRGTGPSLQGEPTRRISGIVGDTHSNGLSNPADAMVFVPVAQVTNGYTAAYTDTAPLLWVLRTRGDPHQVIAAATEQLRIASGGFPVAHIRTMEEAMGTSTARQSFNMVLFTIFGVVALILAAIGIYGLMAYSVAQRTQEMGIRMALGADRDTIRKLVVWQGMRLALVGVVAGIAASFGLTRLLSTFLFGVKPWDPAVFVSAPLILTAIALVAVWLPAARASKVDPMQALRSE
jgi:predicted permease